MAFFAEGHGGGAGDFPPVVEDFGDVVDLVGFDEFTNAQDQVVVLRAVYAFAKTAGFVHQVFFEDDKVADILITIKSSVEETATTIGPLEAKSSAQSKGKEKGPFVYTFSHWAK